MARLPAFDDHLGQRGLGEVRARELVKGTSDVEPRFVVARLLLGPGIGQRGVRDGRFGKLRAAHFKRVIRPGDPKDDAQLAAMDSVPVEGLSKEEAIRILEAMREQEKELQKQKARQVKVKSRRVDKDW